MNQITKMIRFLFTFTILSLLVFAIAGTAGAQDRVGEPKGDSLALQAVAVTPGLTAAQLADNLLDATVSVSNVSYTGAPAANGTFSGGAVPVGFESGIILSSGRTSDAPGPNTSDSTTTDFFTPGDGDLNALVNGGTEDAAVLEFDFECPAGTGGEDFISFQYVFSSEEYNEYVGSVFNDVFAFFLNGTNIALIPGTSTPVAINNVNLGSNSAYYINNSPGSTDLEADGLTVVLGAEGAINAGINHMKIAIADRGDTAYDSWVFIEEGSFTCAPLNSPPVADPNGPYLGAANTDIEFDGSGSSDPDGDALTYDWDWGDGSSSPDAGAMPTYQYAAAGIYTVCLTVDDGLATDTACTMVVVYDPAAGFVTGGGWIYSEAGSYGADVTLEGKANFGFVSKYKKGATVPTGNTEFQFQAAGLNFHSSSYDWLVVTGSDYAKFKGYGTVNGAATNEDGEAYRFMVWAGDDAPDTFHIKIWTEDGGGSETIVYDNGVDQEIGGGSIVIHSK